MQYILTQSEYDQLLGRKEEKKKASNDKLQRFCTLAAEHIPVRLSWSPDGMPAPWGCILLRDAGSVNAGYCDQCPSQEFCPYEHKEYSK